MVLTARAFFVLAEWRISADHQEILTGEKALMSCASQQDGNVARLQLQNTAPMSAELHLAFTAGNAKHFVDAGMVMHIIVNAVTPGVAPAVAVEQLFEHGRRVELLRKPQPGKRMSLSLG